MDREKIIFRAGVVDIAVNLTLTIFKIIVGVISNSIAIISDALHGLVDSISGLLIAISGKITSSKTFKNSPAKSARLEFTTAFLIACIIVIVGVTVLIESIEKIITPEPVEYSVPTIIILAASVLGKLFLGIYLKRRGKAISSDSLKTGGTESLNDVLISAAVLASALIYVIWQIDIEAYVSAAIALIIIANGAVCFFELRTKRLQTHTESRTDPHKHRD